jgi:hypothetical protein
MNERDLPSSINITLRQLLRLKQSLAVKKIQRKREVGEAVRRFTCDDEDSKPTAVNQLTIDGRTEQL